MANAIDRLTEALDRMSRRERLLVVGMAATFAVLVVALLGYLTLDGIESRRERNEKYRRVIDKLEKNRPRLVQGQEGDTAATARLDRKPPALQGHLDALASRFEVEIKDYKPSKPKQLGPKKEVTEEALVVSLYDIGLDKLMQFLNAVEAGGHFLVTTELSIMPRSGQHDRLDVKTLKVSAYEWTKDTATPPEKGKSDAKGKSKKGKQP
jgi:hypothetical protein